jgi:uncharacterized protein YukE
VGVVWANRYGIYDFIVLFNYEAPNVVAALAADDTMTDRGRRLFYVNKPQISDREQFNTQCKTTEQTVVLGCYTGVAIYIFKVDDPTLKGVEQVTAAHEMLHAAYSRLSSSEKKRIDILVDAIYKKLNDPRINALAASYEKQEPGSVPNELHSILATEVKDVGSELEGYYRQYFTDRRKVVGYSETYSKVFEDLKNQVDNYDADLALRKSQINSLEDELQQMANNLKTQKSKMDALLASNRTDDYNAQVPSYNASVNTYNDKLVYLRQLIEEYNAIVIARNNVAVEQQNLAQSIDSRLSPIQN